MDQKLPSPLHVIEKHFSHPQLIDPFIEIFSIGAIAV